MIVSLFTTVDSQLALWLMTPARVIAWAMISGVVSMLVYKKFSPQQRIKDLEQLAAAVQLELKEHQGDFAEALPLLRRNVGLALRRLQAALLPSVLAGLPVLLVLYGMDAIYQSETVLTFGPAWVRSWLAAFITVSCAAALITKSVFRIR